MNFEKTFRPPNNNSRWPICTVSVLDERTGMVSYLRFSEYDRFSNKNLAFEYRRSNFSYSGRI